MDLTQKLKELESKYSDEPKKEEVKQILQFVSVSFSKGGELESSFLSDFEDFGFTKVKESFRNNSYYSNPLDSHDAEFLQKVLNKKKSTIPSFIYDNESPKYSDVIKENNNNIIITSYLESDRASRIDPAYDQSMTAYLNNVYNYEERILNTDFRKDFCEAMVDVIKNNCDTSQLRTTFMTEDPVKSLVYETYDWTQKLVSPNGFEPQSIHYPHLYLVSSLLGYNNREESNIIRKAEELKTYHIYDIVKEIVDYRFKEIDSIKPLNNFKDMSQFPKSLDYDTLSEDSGYSIPYTLSKEFIINDYRSIKESITGAIVKASINQALILNAHKLHTSLNDIDASPLEAAAVIKEQLKDQFDTKDWKTHFADVLDQSPSPSDVHIMKKQTKMKP